MYTTSAAFLIFLEAILDTLKNGFDEIDKMNKTIPGIQLVKVTSHVG